jgi:hypothetical protein
MINPMVYKEKLMVMIKNRELALWITLVYTSHPAEMTGFESRNLPALSGTV